MMEWIEKIKDDIEGLRVTIGNLRADVENDKRKDYEYRTPHGSQRVKNDREAIKWLLADIDYLGNRLDKVIAKTSNLEDIKKKQDLLIEYFNLELVEKKAEYIPAKFIKVKK